MTIRDAAMALIDRRAALAGLAGAGSSLAAASPSLALPSGSHSPMGEWGVDAHGLPHYTFNGRLPVTTTTPDGRAYPLDPDPVFLLGNYDLTLFASAGGRMQFISGERGWVHLNEPTATVPGNAATLTVTAEGRTRTHDLLGLGGVCAAGEHVVRTFGCGMARYRMTPQPGLTVERILSVPPSTATHRAEAAVVITVRLTNHGAVRSTSTTSKPCSATRP